MKINNIKRSPIFYMGNKYKLLKQLIPLFPDECKTFIDLFGGSGVVCMNYKGKEKTIYNEFNDNIVGLIKMIVDNEPKELDEYWNKIINEYGFEVKSKIRLDMNTKNDYINRINCFNKFREYYNKSTNRDYKDLFLLSCYSINHLIRFNKNNEFNASSGNNSYNDKNYKQVCDMHDEFKDIEIINGNAFDLNLDELDKDTFIYCDPPYTNTEAVYNEKRAFGGWNIDSDYKLFDILEKLNNKGILFGLSNVFKNRGVVNQHLIDWCKNNKWNVYHLNINYNPFSRGNSNNDEVYICNYKNNINKQISFFD